MLECAAENLALESELKAVFDRVLRSGHYILGEKVERFEECVAEKLGVRHAIGVSSGTDALLLALMALGIGEGDEVLCPSFTFFASAGSIARTGAKPVFVDVRADTFNIDVSDAARKVTKATRAIMPVHLYGQAADMVAVMDLAAEHGLAVLEDAAQALGARADERRVGTIGEFGAFSFYPTKNLGALGDAGLLVTNKDDLADMARKLRVHGGHQRYYHDHVGGNFRMDALQGALLGPKLARLDDYTARRRTNATGYRDRLQPLAECHGDLVLPEIPVDDSHVWNQFTIRLRGVGRRDGLKKFLEARKVGCEVYYPLALHQQKCFAALGETSLPVSERLAGEVLSLPNHPGLEDMHLDHVVELVGQFLATDLSN
jgi:dTDP-4-amino-4,6-dideoxygalactose transaminase